MPGANFGAGERRRQTAFRTSSATISAAGRRHGHMLALGRETENLHPSLRGERGALAVFGRRRIRWWAHKDFDRPGKRAPTRNMASLQIACVNFLLQLTDREEALLAVLRAIGRQ